MLSSLGVWRNIAARSRDLDILFPTGQTNVEGGFFALRKAMFTEDQRTVSEEFFAQAGQAAVMSLNYHLLHRHHIPLFTRGDSSVMRFLERTRVLLLEEAGLEPGVITAAEASFRVAAEAMAP